MASPFCTACGATIADGTRFCIKCGTPVGQAAPSPPPPPQVPTPMPPAVSDETVHIAAPQLAFTPRVEEAPAAPPPPPPPMVPPPTAYAPPAQTFVPPPQNYAPPPPMQPPPMAPPPPPMAPQTSGGGMGAGIWIGLIGLLLLIGGSGLWFYTTRMAGSHAASPTPPGVQVADAPAPPPTPAPEPVSTSTPAPAPTQRDAVPPPAPSEPTKPEDIPPNPDFAKKDPAPRQAPPLVRSRPPANSPPAAPPPQPVRAANPTSGNLHASVEVALNGEVVFENLPGARLRFTYDHAAWQPTIHRQPNGTQTLVMRSLKPGIQRSCDVRWEIVGVSQ